MSSADYKKKIEELKENLKPFENEYFKGLTYEHIAALAKKSIKITAENTELEHKLESLKEQYQFLSECHEHAISEKEGLLESYKKFIDIAKQNSDCFEYCMQSVEKENERLRERIKVMEQKQNEADKERT